MASLFDTGIFSVVGLDGEVLVGAQLSFYTAGTSAKQYTYTDSSLTIANSNPVIAQGDGRFPQIWLADLAYKFVLQDATGIVLYTQDNYSGGASAASLSSEVTRATNAEAALSGRVAATEATGAALTTRMTTAEGNIVNLQTLGSTGGTLYYPTWPALVAATSAYNAATAYTKGQTLVDQGVMWVNILASTAVAPPTLPTTSNTNWQVYRNPLVGQAFAVPTTDAGTHTDPTDGTTKNNTGVFSWQTGASGTGPKYLFATDAALAQIYSAAALASANAAAASAAAIQSPNFLFDALNQYTFDTAMLGYWNWYRNSNAITWTLASANIAGKYPVAQLAGGAGYKKQWDWNRLNRRVGEAIVAKAIVYATATGTLSVVFRDASNGIISNTTTAIAATGLQTLTIAVTVPAGAIASMEIGVTSTAAFEVGGLFAAVGGTAPSPTISPIDRFYYEAWNLAKGRTPNVAPIDKSLVESWTTQTLPATTAGYYISPTTGLPIASANYGYTSYTPTGQEVAFRLTTVAQGSGTYQAIYVDDFGNVIGKEGQGIAATLATILTPPFGWAKMWITGYNTGPIVLETGNLGVNVGPRLVSAEASIAALKSWNDLPLSIVTGYYVSRFAPFQIIASAAYEYAKIDLTVNPGPLRVSSRAQGSGVALVVYTYMVAGVETFLSYQFDGTTPQTYVQQVLTIPALATAAYIGGVTAVPMSAQQYGVRSAANNAPLPRPGIRIGFLGNSFTAQGNYQAEVLRITGGVQSFNNGNSGQDFGYLADTAMSAVDLSATDVLVVTEGANEWGSGNRPLGTIADASSVNSTYGKMRSIFEQAYAKNGNILVIFTGKTYSGHVYIAGSPGYLKDTDASANGRGYTGDQVDAAIKGFCDGNYIPFCDWRHLSGINASTDANNGATSGAAGTPLVWTIDGLHPTPATAANGGSGPRLGRELGAVINRGC